MSDQKKKPTLMLLPGLLCDDYTFAACRKHLDDAADVIVPNFLGFDSIVAMAESVLAQAPQRFSLAGFSMGGRVAFQVVRMAPERVERFCVFDTGAPPAGEGEPAKRQILIDLAHQKGMAAVAESWLPPMVHPDRVKDEAFMRPLLDMVERVSPDVFEKQIKALLTRPDARPVLPTIRCPSLVLCGAQDAWSPPEQAKEIADAIPGAELKIIDNSGHFLPTEQPEAFAAALRDWLAKPV
jgi:pimeloyl-ACP methyl ester carboxylesterase